MQAPANKAPRHIPLLCLHTAFMVFPPSSHKSSHRQRRASLALRLLLLALLPVLAAGNGEPREADKDTTAIVQASYIYNIAKLVEWRDPAMKSGPFVISILGSSNLYQELVKKYAAKSIGRQAIEVRKLVRNAEVDRCHILFVSQTELTLLPTLYKKLEKQSTLLVTEYPDALEDGAVVNFVRVDNTLKYEISVANARRHKLDVGSTLVQLSYKAQQ